MGDLSRGVALRDALVILAILSPLFVLHARWGEHATTDAIAAAAPAWQLVETGSIDVTEYADRNPWFVPGRDGRYYSDRAPGLIAVAVPGYLVWQVEEFVNGPASLMALLTALAAVLMVWWLSLPHVGRIPALLAALVFGLGTTTWTVSAAQLWPHGPGQLAALLTLAGFASQRYVPAGIATAAAVIVRPIAAVWSAILGLAEGRRLRSVGLVARYGSLAVAGVVLVVVYNRWLFTEGVLRGGTEGVTAGFGAAFGPGWYLRNLWETFAGWPNGVLLLSPVVLVAAVGAARYRDSIPGWARNAALAGLGYLIVHAALNRASGGMEIFYRYPLEPLALSSVALVIGGVALYRSSPPGRLAVVAAAVVSILLQVYEVFFLACRSGPDIMSCGLF